MNNINDFFEDGISFIKSSDIEKEPNNIDELVSLVDNEFVNDPCCTLTTDLEGTLLDFEGRGYDGFALRMDGQFIGKYHSCKECIGDINNSLTFDYVL